MDMTDSPEDFPQHLAIFPLNGALLLPGGRLPLHIFEPRYVAMVEDALASGRTFGMIQEDRAGQDEDSVLYRVGCLGRISSFSETEDGRYLVTLTGLIRFRVVRELAAHRGYRRVIADYSRFAADLAIRPDADVLRDREALLGALRAYFQARGFEANWDAIEQMPDELLVVTLAMVCPFEPAEKQALLEADTPAARAEALLALLTMGAHESGDAQLRS
jgi:Lon protease-like protein